MLVPCPISCSPHLPGTTPHGPLKRATPGDQTEVILRVGRGASRYGAEGHTGLCVPCKPTPVAVATWHRAQGCWLPAPGHGTSVTARASLFSSPYPLRGPQPSAHPHRNPIPTGTEDSSSVGTSSVQPLGDVSCQSPVLNPALLALLGRQPRLPEGGSVTSVATATPPPGSPQSQSSMARLGPPSAPRAAQ